MPSQIPINSTLNEQPCTINTSGQITANGTLDQLNAVERNKHIGGVIFVSTLMAVGIFGNLHVLFVYIFKTKASSRRTFIVVLGALDFVASSVGMPFIVFDLLNPLTFDVPSLCKMLRFVNYFVSLCSIFILLVIAVDRYRKVCQPLGWQISRSMATYLCLGFILLSGSISWPAAVLYGSTARGTSDPEVSGISCLIKEEFGESPYPFLFNTMLLLIVFVISTCLIVLYCLMWRAISTFRMSTINIKHDEHSGTTADSMQKHHGKSPPREYSSNAEVRSNDHSSIGSSCGEPEIGAIYHVTMTSSSSSSIDLFPNGKFKDGGNKGSRSRKYVVDNEEEASKVRSSVRPFAKIHRTTLTFCLITIVFIISYFPHLILKIISFTKSGFFDSMSANGQVVYNTFIWCFYFNNVANAIIYGFCDNKFREEISLLYKSAACGCSCVCN